MTTPAKNDGQTPPKVQPPLIRSPGHIKMGGVKVATYGGDRFPNAPVTPPPQLKYLLVGGTLVFSSDVAIPTSYVRYITAKSLIDLYGLDRRECVLFDCGNPADRERYLKGAEEERLILLFPVQSGDYAGELKKVLDRFNKDNPNAKVVENT